MARNFFGMAGMLFLAAMTIAGLLWFSAKGRVSMRAPIQAGQR